jgi:hypothetical protein
MLFKTLFLTVLIYISIGECLAQNISVENVQDSCSYNFSVEQGKKAYAQKFYHPLMYINGEEYKIYHRTGHSNPYFNSNAGMGLIYYQQQFYTDLLLYYDIFQQQLVVSPNEPGIYGEFIKVRKAYVDSFMISFTNSKHIFYHLKFKEENGLPNLDAYYEILYQGKYQLLYYYSAIVTTDNTEKKYIQKQDRIIGVDGQYYIVNKRSKLLKLFPDHRKAIRKEIMSNAQRSYKSLTTNQLVELIRLIESL